MHDPECGGPAAGMSLGGTIATVAGGSIRRLRTAASSVRSSGRDRLRSPPSNLWKSSITTAAPA